MAKRQNPKPKPGKVKAAPKKPASGRDWLKEVNGHLEKHSRKIMIGLFVLSMGISGWYYMQGHQSPIRTVHHWVNSDMAFFDTWATYVSEGNWWQDTMLHPYHDWHDEFATEYFKKYPEIAAPYYSQSGNGGVPDSLSARHALINDIYKGKTFHQEPLYTYMVAITYALFGKDHMWIYFWQFLLAAFTGVLVFLIGRKYFDSVRGLLAALFVTLCGTILIFQMVLLRTTLTNFFTVLLLYLYLEALEKPDWKKLSLFGAASGFALLSQSYFIIFLLPAWAWFVWTHRKNIKGVGLNVVTYLAALMIVLSPLCIRNSKVGVPLTAMAGHGAMAYIPMNTIETFPMESFYIHMPTLVRLRHDGDGKMIRTAWLCLGTFDSFGSFWKIYKTKLSGMFMWYELPNNMNYYLFKEFAPILGLLPVRYYFLAPLGLAGLILGFYRYRQRFIPFFLMVVACMLPLIIAGNLARYRTPLVMMMALSAAFCIVEIIRWISENKWKPALVGAGLCALAFVYTSSIVRSTLFTINTNDLEAMYKLHYQERLVDLEAKHDDIGYLALTTELMGYIPDYFIQSTQANKVKASNEADACLYVANLIQMHATTLKVLQRQQESDYYQERVNVLKTRANEFKNRVGLK